MNLRKPLIWLMLSLSLVIFLAACDSEDTPVADEDGPILSGLADMPKMVVTVALSATPDVVVSPTPQPLTPTITETPEPPDPTRTPTAVVGIFVGDTDDNGTPIAANVDPIVIDAGGNSGSAPPISSGGGGSGSVSTSGSGSVPSGCTAAVDQSFNNAYTQNPAVASILGCPLNAGYGLTLVGQTFERGQMFWRDTKEIYALPANNRYVKFIDTWTEGMPESDPAFSAPQGVSQPIRGFGLAWRSNEGVRNALGWAITSETAFLSYWQEFQGGFMFLADNNRVYALVPDAGNPNEGTYYGPFSR